MEALGDAYDIVRDVSERFLVERHVEVSHPIGNFGITLKAIDVAVIGKFFGVHVDGVRDAVRDKSPAALQRVDVPQRVKKNLRTITLFPGIFFHEIGNVIPVGKRKRVSLDRSKPDFPNIVEPDSASRRSPVKSDDNGKAARLGRSRKFAAIEHDMLQE